MKLGENLDKKGNSKKQNFPNWVIKSYQEGEKWQTIGCKKEKKLSER